LKKKEDADNEERANDEEKPVIERK